jgi:hypothetical protein
MAGRDGEEEFAEYAATDKLPVADRAGSRRRLTRCEKRHPDADANPLRGLKHRDSV